MSVDPRLGTELAGYRIESVIGRGGMSVVYLAEHLGLGRKVALKVLAPELAEDEKFRERFVRESRIAAGMEHPNIIPVYEAGEAQGVLYIAMRYVKGTDLKGLIGTEGVLPAARTVALLSQAGNALDAAHAEGLVHRDVKPGNILLAPPRGPGEGEHVYLSDFGLTKRTSSESGLTDTGQFVGTLDYAAPEQFEGKVLDGRADVYSLGCVLYECLTGLVPFQKDQQAALMYAHLMSPPPKATEARPELGGAIDGVIGKAMAKKPEDRYGACSDLVQAAGEALGATDSVVVAPSPGLSWRRPGVLGALAAALAVIVALVVILSTKGGGGGGTPSPTAITSIPADSLGVLDPGTGRILKTVKVGSKPTAVVFGEGSIWVANSGDGTVSQIDPKTYAVKSIGVGGAPISLAIEGGLIWYLDASSDILNSISPATGTPSPTPIALELNAASVASGDGVLVGGGGGIRNPMARLYRIDPQTRTVQKSVDFFVGGGALSAVVAGEGAVWVAAGTLRKFDPGTLKSLDQIGFSIGTNEADYVATGGGAVWVASRAGSAYRIDPATDNIDAIITLGGQPSGIAVGPNAVWVSDARGSLFRIDPKTNKLVKKYKVGSSPSAVALSPTAVLVVAQTF